MSKAILNQKYIYKINSSRFRVHNWDMRLTVDEAIKNGEYISIGDSIALRMIEKIRNENFDKQKNENDIFKAKKERRKYRSRLQQEKMIEKLSSDLNKITGKNATESNKLKIKEINKRIHNLSFIPEYITIIFDNDIDWKRANNKEKSIKLNGVEFVRLVGTNGGIKKNTVVFCDKRIHKELDMKLNCGRDASKKLVPAKFEAYKALAFSGSTPVTQPKGVLVIKDGITNFKEDVIRVSSKSDDKNENEFKVELVKNYDIERQFADGSCMISPSLAKQWTIDLEIATKEQFECMDKDREHELICSGFNIRNFTLKGMVGTFDFIQFTEEIANDKIEKPYIVVDAWGNEIDIRTVDLIVTTNMLKLWDSYKDVNDYLKKTKKNGFEFCVAKALPLELEKVRNMNYQFLQSYEFTDNDIDELINPTVKMINGLKNGDYGKSMLFLKGNKVSEKDFEYEECDYMKALMIEPKLVSDPFITDKVNKMIRKKVNDAKKGVIQVQGNYSIVFGDLYALCEYMFGLDVRGLLKAKEYYSHAWSSQGINEVVAFRAPQTNHNNIRKMKLIYNEEAKKWFKYIKTGTILNAWDTTMDAMNGLDYDGDAVITTNNPVLLKRTRELLAIVCEQKSAEKKVITEKLLMKANKNGFNNDVGGVTNKGTSMFDVLSKFEKGSDKYNEMLDRIICMQGYQQEIIDSCKGIIPKRVPKQWYDYNSIKIKKDSKGNILDSEEDISKKKKLQDLCCSKKPYFFIYNYSNIKNEYNNYNKNYNENSYIRFGMSLEDILKYKSDFKELSNEQIIKMNDIERDAYIKTQKREQDIKNFIKYYHTNLPVSMAKSTMNKICWRLEERFDAPKMREEEFDKELLKTSKKYNKNDYDKIFELYEKYKESVSNYRKKPKNAGKEETKDITNNFRQNFKMKALEICNNEEDLCNIVIDICYTNTLSKSFAWAVSGEQIVKNLLNKNKVINYPVADNHNGDIEWNGNKYKIIQKQI